MVLAEFDSNGDVAKYKKKSQRDQNQTMPLLFGIFIPNDASKKQTEVKLSRIWKVETP